MKALDAGAEGVICPMVNTAEEAARLVSYMRYPPDGVRSYGPTRALFAHGEGYAATANARVMAFAMIETAEGLANLEAIVATPGLDGIYVGPNDLALSVSAGKLPPGLDREEPEMLAASAGDCRGLPAAWADRGDPLRDGRLCRPCDRLGLPDDDRGGRRALPFGWRGTGGRRVPAVDRGHGCGGRAEGVLGPEFWPNPGRFSRSRPAHRRSGRDPAAGGPAARRPSSPRPPGRRGCRRRGRGGPW